MNEKITVKNTCIVINDYNLGDCPNLEQLFSVYDPIKHKYESFGIFYDEENKKLYLPAGVDLWKIKQYFNEKYFERLFHHKYKKIDNIKIKYTPRDDVQYEAIYFMCGINEYEANANLNQLSLNLNTGKGKTYCSIATICYFQIKTIIITASNSLLSQWKSEILKYTNLQDKDIMQLNGSDVCNMILSGKSNKANNASIFLCSHGTLRSFGDTYGWNKVYELFVKLGIGIKIFDEAHQNYENMLMIDYFTNVFKTYYVTATSARSDWKENRIFQISLKNVPNIDLFDETKDKHTSYIAIKWNSKPSPLQISMCKNPMYGLDRNKYVDYVTKKPEFYSMMRIIMDLVIKCKGRVLMYIGTNDGILRLYHWIATNYPEFLGDIGIFTSLVSKEQKLIEKQKKLILTTTKSAGVGEHIEHLKMTIVLAEPFKSEVLARQTLGRTRDDNTMYIELVDLGFKYIRKYYYAKLPIFNKYASDVSDMTIDQYELDKRVDRLLSAREREKQGRVSPIIFKDDRFDFNSILPKSNNDN